MTGSKQPLAPPPVAGAEEVTAPDWRVLLFLHIPKTAGLNLRHVINRQYGLENVFVPEPGVDTTRFDPYWKYVESGTPLPRKDRPGANPNKGPLRELSKLPPERLEALRVVMGHFWYGLHESLPRPASYFTVVREPVERVLSVYYHRAGRHGLKLSLEEYLATGRDFEIDNAQVRFLCGPIPDADIRFTECTSVMLEQAKRHLRERFVVVGLAERFDETFLLLARTLGWREPSYDLYNVNRRRPRGRAVPDAIRQRIAERNRFDAELYAFAEKLFDQQLAAMDPPIDARMARGFRRSNLLRRHPNLRRLYDVLKPVLRSADSIGTLANRFVSAFRNREA